MQNTDLIRTKFKNLWLYYILQSLLAAVAIFILLILMKKERMVSVSAMAATCFIVFAMPKSVSARSRNILGGHVIGLFCGAAFGYLIEWPYFIEYPLAVGIAIFLMVALDVEHPPAAGTALAVAINEVNAGVFLVILISALVLSRIHWHLRHYLRDLV